MTTAATPDVHAPPPSQPGKSAGPGVWTLIGVILGVLILGLLAWLTVQQVRSTSADSTATSQSQAADATVTSELALVDQQLNAMGTVVAQQQATANAVAGTVAQQQATATALVGTVAQQQAVATSVIGEAAKRQSTAAALSGAAQPALATIQADYTRVKEAVSANAQSISTVQAQVAGLS